MSGDEGDGDAPDHGRERPETTATGDDGGHDDG